MDQICKYVQCTGCSACMNICPKGAISMIPQGPLGDIHPSIDINYCIDCHLCSIICPSNNPIHNEYPLHAYALISNDKSDLLTSSSGGASSLLSQTIIAKGGVVYGCVEDDYQHIAHKRIDSDKDLPLIKKSKYVQSDIGFAYKDVRKDLITGRKVLFIGTPCQIAGLKSFLRKDYENLLLVDLVCHGVPSQKLLRQDIDYLLNGVGKSHEDISVIFREKRTVLGLKNGREIIFGIFLKDKTESYVPIGSKGRVGEDFYITAFLNGLIFRDSCYQCQYAKPERVGDITIADFWGIGKTSVPGGNGRSLVLVNTSKGEDLFADIRPISNYEEKKISEAIAGNTNLQHPSSFNSERTKFISNYLKNNRNACNKYISKFRYRGFASTFLSRLHLLSLAKKIKNKISK